MTLMQTEGLDSYGCFSIENHKFICVCLKNSILETMSLQHSCWNLKLNFCLSSVQSVDFKKADSSDSRDSRSILYSYPY